MPSTRSHADIFSSRSASFVGDKVGIGSIGFFLLLPTKYFSVFCALIFGHQPVESIPSDQMNDEQSSCRGSGEFLQLAVGIAPDVLILQFDNVNGCVGIDLVTGKDAVSTGRWVAGLAFEIFFGHAFGAMTTVLLNTRRSRGCLGVVPIATGGNCSRFFVPNRTTAGRIPSISMIATSVEPRRTGR